MGGGNRADPPAPPGHWVVALEALLMATAEPSHSDNDSDDDDEPDYVNVPLNSPHVRKLESTLQLLDDLIDAARKSRAESEVLTKLALAELAAMMPAEEGALLSADSPGALLGLLVGKLRTLRAELDAAWDDMRVEESDAFTSSSDFVEYLRGLLFSVLQIGDVNPDDQTPEPEVVQPALDDPRQDESPGEERFYTCRTSPPPLPPRRQRRASPKHFFKLAMPEPTGCTDNSRECTNNEACSARILATSSSSGTAGNTTDREPAAAQPPAADHAAEHPADRPKSFLREEVDEFEKIFSELLLNGNKGQSSLSSSQETLAADDDDVTECADDDNEDMLRRLRNRLPGGAPPREKEKPPSPPEPVKPPTDSDQLFSQLLDDLDNITVNASSVKRRQKAREIFSDWLFNRDAPHGTAHDIVRRRRKTSASAREAASKRLSADVAHFDARRHELLAQWRPRSFEYQSEIASSRAITSAGLWSPSTAPPPPPPPVWRQEEVVCSSSTAWFFKRTESRRNWRLDSLRSLGVNSATQFRTSIFRPPQDEDDVTQEVNQSAASIALVLLVQYVGKSRLVC
ncbi:hypothetical protein CAPTEDRAFT_220189 [Capitella teleta]|uniref:Uncharacterized protein n=1 Tax=Capitella teleta TaxID=283909 RepID=R7V0F2_CAPTE|nr:hypothetical protein CAPTEDRAFT_220189 [Capitella teleta]|eukprot:ELU12313.1 hypothetical protein CAPTEDRAFT_220189 [Capitella teleta]